MNHDLHWWLKDIRSYGFHTKVNPCKGSELQATRANPAALAEWGNTIWHMWDSPPREIWLHYATPEGA